ncbi:lipocalin family protein [Psychrosphaera ytuae]|uniref:Outer membrane lipoprotein Blc n=1 Tax=Psychrosphaera ytuae TaxID=2820710 RepID=A0A975HK42_9GAMM|nr:lipocalin family protein [Psychrosphaera ytuae]QTH63914.1 lipocalin family protein [Psychrosphaera ytuae]
MKKYLLSIAFLLTACTGVPDKVTPVNNFDLNRYLGTWYEVARLDHSFERGLSQITATYSLKDDGGVRVLNKGYDVEEKEWREAEGKAYFVDASDVGHLKVSFFGPFYGSYVVFELDQEEYQYAFVSGPDTSYLWFLSRTPEVSPELMNKFKTLAKEKGFDTSKLIFVEH